MPNTTSSSALSSASKIMIEPFVTSFKSAGRTTPEPDGLKATTTGTPLFESFFMLSHFSFGKSIFTSVGSGAAAGLAAAPAAAAGAPPPKPPVALSTTVVVLTRIRFASFRGFLQQLHTLLQ